LRWQKKKKQKKRTTKMVHGTIVVNREKLDGKKGHLSLIEAQQAILKGRFTDANHLNAALVMRLYAKKS